MNTSFLWPWVFCFSQEFSKFEMLSFWGAVQSKLLCCWGDLFYSRDICQDSALGIKPQMSRLTWKLIGRWCLDKRVFNLALQGAEVRTGEEAGECVPSEERDLTSPERLRKPYGKNTPLWDRADWNSSSIMESSLTQLLLDALQSQDDYALNSVPPSVLDVLAAVQQVTKQCPMGYLFSTLLPCYRKRVRFIVRRTLHYCTAWTKLWQIVFLQIVWANHVLVSVALHDVQTKCFQTSSSAPSH